MRSVCSDAVETEAFDSLRGLVSVSRETETRLSAYVALLVKWTTRINLVGPATVSEVWRRHILDSLQLLPLVEGAIADVGSGAGLPGMILALCGAGPVTLIESDQRKCAFLREAARVTGTTVSVLPQRIEDIKIEKVDTVTARALAPVETLLHYALPLLKPGGRCVFPKGARAMQELEAARRQGWVFSCRSHPSLSDPNGTILVLETISRDSAN